jgi:hypothetical protein
MKNRKILVLTLIAAVALLLAGAVGVVLAQGPPLGASVGTAFTYQGQLIDDDDPATGTYDFEFKLHDDPTLDSQVGGIIYVDDKEVNEGLFTVQLDFGSGVFAGEARYLEIGVRAGGSSGDYTTLAPRQELTAAPYALHSLSTGALQGNPVSDTVPSTGQLLQWNGSAWEPANPNQAPQAALHADNSVLMPGETTTLSLTLSYDPEGGPLTYAFDPTGETVGPPSAFGSTAVNTLTSADYTAPGDYLAAGWVKDEVGFCDVARIAIAVYQWSYTTADTSGDVGEYASLAVVDGRPAIAYHDAHPNYDLKYVRANDASGSSWATPLTVDSTGIVGEYASLAVVDGCPAIAYYDFSNNQLKYVRANDGAGSSWGTPLRVNPIADSAQGHASLAVVNGDPAIAYFGGSSDLKYLRANDPSGSSWPATVLTVDSTGTVGEYASLAVVDGRPAIAYYNNTNDDLKYVRASDASGSSWGTPLTVDSTGSVGQYASLAVVDGRPAIAYYDSAPNYDLKYVRANDATGSSWGTPVTVDSTGDVGEYASLAVVDGHPAIAYHDYDHSDLKYVRASDASGSSWPTAITIHSTGSVGEYASLAQVDDRPAIAYYDDLWFAIPRKE